MSACHFHVIAVPFSTSKNQWVFKVNDSFVKYQGIHCVDPISLWASPSHEVQSHCLPSHQDCYLSFTVSLLCAIVTPYAQVSQCCVLIKCFHQCLCSFILKFCVYFKMHVTPFCLIGLDDEPMTNHKDSNLEVLCSSSASCSIQSLPCLWSHSLFMWKCDFNLKSDACPCAYPVSSVS